MEYKDLLEVAAVEFLLLEPERCIKCGKNSGSLLRGGALEAKTQTSEMRALFGWFWVTEFERGAQTQVFEKVPSAGWYCSQ